MLWLAFDIEPAIPVDITTYTNLRDALLVCLLRALDLEVYTTAFAHQRWRDQ